MPQKEKFCVRFHEKVLAEDLAHLKPTFKDRLLRFIKEKLAKRPFAYGKPLRVGNDGYRKVRLGDYILAYRVLEDQILILSFIPFYKLYEKQFFKGVGLNYPQRMQ